MKMRDRRRRRQPGKRQIAIKRLQRVLGRPLEDAMLEMWQGKSKQEVLEGLTRDIARFVLRECVVRPLLPKLLAL